MIEEAIVDAYDESEQATGWFTMFENHLELPFETQVLGVRVTVEKIELRCDNRIVAVCRRGKAKQSITITDLPLSTPKPPGAEWIERGVLSLERPTMKAPLRDASTVRGAMDRS
ncbi:MAG TPA: calcium-binding protein [Polyangiaceae bacterium]|nr:calcium-binding protein [Polyangiaceae bacterium]